MADQLMNLREVERALLEAVNSTSEAQHLSRYYTLLFGVRRQIREVESA